METRNIPVTIAKAKQWYYDGGTILRELALQTFTEEELTTPYYENIKTFKDAIIALGLCIPEVEKDIKRLKEFPFEGDSNDYLIACYKLNIIRKALNGNWKPNLIKGEAFYPEIKIVPADAIKEYSSCPYTDYAIGKIYIINNKQYQLVGGLSEGLSFGGISKYIDDSGKSVVNPTLSLLCCESEKIARHMSKYFMEEIFQATYSQHKDLYT